ncbi:MAG: hypothetical protein ACYTKD_23370 [Planctomycetota bacterium]|jgi:hypothetical protein
MPPHVLAHLSLMALLIALLVTAVVVARLRRGAWVARHRIVAIAGVALGGAGALTMAVAKHLNGWPHLFSSHSKVGLAALIVVLAAPVLGTLLVKGRAKLRQPHRIVGGGTIALAVVAAALRIIPFS